MTDRLHADQDLSVGRHLVAANGKTQDGQACRYRFRVRTADEAGAGTDSNIFLILYGEYGQTSEVRLNGHVHGNAFERGRTDTFDIDLQAVGRIYKIRIRSDTLYPASAWRLGSIEVIALEPPQTPAQFVYEDWLSDRTPREITATGWGMTFEGDLRSQVTARTITAVDLLDTDQSVEEEYTVTYTITNQVELSSDVKQASDLTSQVTWESPAKIFGMDLGTFSADVKATWAKSVEDKRVDTTTLQLDVTDRRKVTFPARRATLVMVEWTQAYTAMLARLGSASLGMRWLDAVPAPAGWTLKSLGVGDEVREPFLTWLQDNRPDLLARLRRPAATTYCHYLARIGDTWDAVATRILGDAKRAGELRLANPTVVVPQPGRRLAVPWPTGELTYSVQPGDGFWAAARAVYGHADSDLVHTVQEWNGGAEHALRPQEVLCCPA